jgi:hypothetical protein
MFARQAEASVMPGFIIFQILKRSSTHSGAQASSASVTAHRGLHESAGMCVNELKTIARRLRFAIRLAHPLRQVEDM